MLTNENNWTLPEPAPEPTPDPIPKPTPKKMGILFLSPEDMQEAKKSMKEKETYNLNPLPIEVTHGLDNPTQVVKVNSLYRYDKVEIPDTSPTYLLFQTLLPLFWTLTCMI